MSAQYAVVAFLRGDLIAEVVGPFRSEEKAEKVCQQINDAGEWTEDDAMFTMIAQVVTISTLPEILEQMEEPE